MSADIARSIVGALAGAIAAIELFKAVRGIRGSTGLIFVPAFATTVMVGRWGCFLSGLEDETHGTPTSLPWGVDLGDGMMRHPVQLYESFTMGLFLLAGTGADRDSATLGSCATASTRLVLVYAGQRFCGSS